MKGIKTWFNCAWKLIPFYPSSISHEIYSLFIGVAHLDKEKSKKKVVHSEPNLNGVTGPVVSSNTFSFWDFNIELTEQRTRWSPPISHEMKLEDWFRHFDYYRCTKNSFSSFNPTQANFFALKTLLGGRCKKGSPCWSKSKCSCLKLFLWKQNSRNLPREWQSLMLHSPRSTLILMITKRFLPGWVELLHH